MSTVAFQDNTPGGTSGSPKTGYMAGIISSGATDAQMSVSNTGTENANFYYRKTGTTTFSLIQLTPGGTPEEFWLSLTSARTIEYYFDAGTVQVSVVDYRTYGSTSAPVTAFTATVPVGSSGSPETGDLSSVVSAGSTLAILRFTNTGEAPMNLYVRKTGTTEYGQPLQIAPGTNLERGIALTAALTFEYYFDNGSLKVEMVFYFRSGLLATLVTVDDIRLVRLGNVYSTDDVSDATIQGYIDSISRKVEKAAERHLAIAMYALDDATKIDTIADGTCWMVLMEIHNKGMSRGLEAQSPRVSLQTAMDFQKSYLDSIERIRSGIRY